MLDIRETRSSGPIAIIWQNAREYHLNLVKIKAEETKAGQSRGRPRAGPGHGFATSHQLALNKCFHLLVGLLKNEDASDPLAGGGGRWGEKGQRGWWGPVPQGILIRV